MSCKCENCKCKQEKFNVAKEGFVTKTITTKTHDCEFETDSYGYRACMICRKPEPKISKPIRDDLHRVY